MATRWVISSKGIAHDVFNDSRRGKWLLLISVCRMKYLVVLCNSH
jgi:hypothetical protein